MTAAAAGVVAVAADGKPSLSSSSSTGVPAGFVMGSGRRAFIARALGHAVAPHLPQELASLVALYYCAVRPCVVAGVGRGELQVWTHDLRTRLTTLPSTHTGGGDGPAGAAHSDSVLCMASARLYTGTCGSGSSTDNDTGSGNGSGSGGLLLTGSVDGSIRVWCTATWTCLAALRGHPGSVTQLLVLPASPAPAVTPAPAPALAPTSSATAPVATRQYVVAGCTSGQLVVWSLEPALALCAAAPQVADRCVVLPNLKLPRTRPGKAGPAPAPSQAPPAAAAAVRNAAPAGVWFVLNGTAGAITGLSPFGPASEGLFVATSADHTLKVWSLVRRANVKTLHGHTAGIPALCAVADTRRLLPATAQRAAVVPAPASSAKPALPIGSNALQAEALAAAEAAAKSASIVPRARPAADARPVLPHHKRPPVPYHVGEPVRLGGDDDDGNGDGHEDGSSSSTSWSASGAGAGAGDAGPAPAPVVLEEDDDALTLHVATADHTTVRVWDLLRNRTSVACRGHGSSVHSLARLGTLPDGAASVDQGLGAVAPHGAPLIASGGSDASIRVWNARTGGEYALLTGGHMGTVVSLCAVTPPYDDEAGAGAAAAGARPPRMSVHAPAPTGAAGSLPPIHAAKAPAPSAPVAVPAAAAPSTTIAGASAAAASVVPLAFASTSVFETDADADANTADAANDLSARLVSAAIDKTLRLWRYAPPVACLRAVATSSPVDCVYVVRD